MNEEEMLGILNELGKLCGDFEDGNISSLEYKKKLEEMLKDHPKNAPIEDFLRAVNRFIEDGGDQ